MGLLPYNEYDEIESAYLYYKSIRIVPQMCIEKSIIINSESEFLMLTSVVQKLKGPFQVILR